jgi:hypothetical protein
MSVRSDKFDIEPTAAGLKCVPKNVELPKGSYLFVPWHAVKWQTCTVQESS